MLDLERTELVIITVLVLALLAGIGVAAYRAAVPATGIGVKQFDPGRYREELPLSAAPTVNINKADAVELARLPGVGAALAARIIRYREDNGLFLSAADIRKVKGIGGHLYEKIKDRISTE